MGREHRQTVSTGTSGAWRCASVWVPSFLLFTALACRPPVQPEQPDPLPSSEERQQRLMEQIEAGRKTAAGDWAPWFEELRRLNRSDRSGAPFYLKRLTERELYDDRYMRRVIEGLTLAESADAAGPIALLADLARQLRERGVDFLVAVIPPRTAVYPEYFGLPIPERSEPHPFLDFRLREVYLALERNGVEVVDLLPALRERRFQIIEDRRGQPYREAVFMEQDAHWTSWAAEITADVIVERIRRYPWFEEVARRQGRPLVVADTRWIRARGPIARRMIERGRLDPDTPKVEYPTRSITILGEEWSHEDHDSPILLIGSSYTRPVHSLPDFLLAQLGFRVDRLTVVGGQPSALLRAVRERGADLLEKELVLWVFPSYGLASRHWRPTPIFPDEGSDR